MANTTRAGALSIHGTNPQYLVPTVIRQRVYDTLYWSASPPPLPFPFDPMLTLLMPIGTS
ncbi:hypothetical protein JCM8547_008553, partial [Rhodosporidiobolus lusitaniae]